MHLDIRAERAEQYLHLLRFVCEGLSKTWARNIDIERFISDWLSVML